jgi:hypothetical protein
METELKNTEQIAVTEDTGKRKRTMSEKQLKALEEGRKRRWLSKQEAKQEQTTDTSEEDTDTTHQLTSESETEPQTTEGETSTADESAESSATNSTSDKTEQSESSEEEDDESEPDEEEEEEQSDSSESEPPSPPVLKRQKAMYNETKNRRASSKMMKYLQAKTNPFFMHMYV